MKRSWKSGRGFLRKSRRGTCQNSRLLRANALEKQGKTNPSSMFPRAARLLTPRSKIMAVASLAPPHFHARKANFPTQGGRLSGSDTMHHCSPTKPSRRPVLDCQSPLCRQLKYQSEPLRCESRKKRRKIGWIFGFRWEEAGCSRL